MHRKTLFLAPRGSLKTTVLNISDNVFDILRDFLLFGDCSITIGIGAEVKDKAIAMVSAIRRHFENPRFQSIFGDLRGTIWREDELSFKGAKLQEKESNVMAFGMDSSAVASRHFKKLVIDDCMSFENSRTYASRDKLWNRFLFDVLPTLEPDSDSKILRELGTRYHPDDFYGREYKQPHVNIRREKAVLDNGLSLCERLFPLEVLLKKQNDNPAVFGAQYQNDVEAMKEFMPLRQEWFKLYAYGQLQRLGLYYQIAVDPGGISEAEQSSGMGVSAIGAQSQPGSECGNVYVLESLNLYGDIFSMAKQVVDLSEKLGWCPIVVEEVALQKVFQSIFLNEAKFRNRPFLNVRGIKSSDLKDKITLASSVTPQIKQGQVFIDPIKTPELYGKLEDYPMRGTDDVNALLINLKDLKDSWMHRLQHPQRQESQGEIKRSSVTGY